MGRSSSDQIDLEQRLARLQGPEPDSRLRERLTTIPDHHPVIVARPRAWRAALALSGALGVILAILLLVMERGTPAFAKVEQALAGIQTATWTEVQKSYQSDGVTPQSETQCEVWVRTKPPLLDRRFNTGQRVLMDEVSTRNDLPAVKQYSNTPFPKLAVKRQFTRQMVVTEIVSPGALSFPATEAGWEGRPDRLEGQAVIRYTREYGRTLKDYPAPLRALANPTRTVQTVWVDEGSSRVLRSERRQYDAKDGHLQFLTVAENYRYNVSPPTGTFEWHVPRGVQEEDTTTREAWHSLPPAERQAIQRTIDRFDAAFVAGDFDRLSQIWDFDFLSRFSRSRESGAEHRRVWKIRVTNLHTYPKRKWKSWRTRVLSGFASRTQLTLGALPPGAPEVLQLQAKSHVTWTDGTTYDADCTYMLAKENGQYRIVNWYYGIPHDVVFGG